jgi:asparagine synthase (glutamine-hydrolysing)
MCGILGVVGRAVEPGRLAALAATMAHRGPDAAGVLHWADGGMAHRRLSILDVSAAANQPLTDPDDRAALLFNGEIYNYRELRAELEAAGAVFRTSSDTEVILHGYLHWGDDVVPRLNGMFAFAVWDTVRHRLLLARDRLGKKPLYLAHLPGGGLLYASELKPLLASGMVDPALDPEAVLDYLQLNYVLHPKTMLRQVRQLPPGYVGRWQDGSFRQERYWDLAACFRAPRLQAARDEELIDELADLMADATRRRLFSDVPLGGFLSGGVDSSTVTALMRQAGADDLHTFSVEFASPEYDEGAYSRLAALLLGTRHHPHRVDEAVGDCLPTFAALLDSPLGDDSAVSAYFLCRWARRHVTVALSGDGADELFAGYTTYVADLLHRRLGPLRRPAAFGAGAVAPLLPESGAKLSRRFQAQRFAQGLRRDACDAHFGWRQVLTDDLLPLVAPDLLPAAGGYSPRDVFRGHYDDAAGADWLDRLLYVDCKTWLVDDILVKVDRVSMAASLECRSPFLDYRVVEWAARLPRRLKLHGLQKKVAVKRLARRWLPAEIVDRKKAGFNSPTVEWLTGPLRETAREALSGGLERLGVRWRGGVERLWDAFQAGAGHHRYALWGLLVLALWERQVLAARGAVTAADTGPAAVRALRRAA